MLNGYRVERILIIIIIIIMRSTGDIQFFVCRSRIIPEPPFLPKGSQARGTRLIPAFLEIHLNDLPRPQALGNRMRIMYYV